MKKAIAILVFLIIPIFSFSQKWKANFGIEGGMGGGGMTKLLKTNNSIIKNNPELKNGFAYSYGIFLQAMQKNFGFEIKMVNNIFDADDDDFTNPENIKLRYLSIPFVLKIRLSTKEGYSSGYWTDESYSLIGNTIYHSPSQYSPGGAFVSSVFLYTGIQYDMLKKATHTYGTSTRSVDDISGVMKETGSSFVTGIEITNNMVSFDFSYQKGITQVISKDNYINAFMIKIKVRLI